jgi:hypothetical protein
MVARLWTIRDACGYSDATMRTFLSLETERPSLVLATAVVCD